MANKRLIHKLMKIKKLNNPDFNRIKQNIDLKYEENSKHHFNYKIALLSIISIALVISGVLGGHKIKVEAALYNEAITFFNENNLQYDNLTKSEIKKVYKDITTQSFSYSKTNELIVENIKNNIEGYEIILPNLPLESSKDIWQYWLDHLKDNKDGIYYSINQVGWYYENSIYHHGKTIISKYDGNKVLWSIEEDDYLNKVKQFNDLCVAYSYSYSKNSNYSYKGITIKSYNSNTGELISSVLLNNCKDDQKVESVGEILYNEDNSFTVVSNVDRSKIVVTHLDESLNIIDYVSNDLSVYGENKFYNVVCVSKTKKDLLMICSYGYYNANAPLECCVFRIDNVGNIVNEFAYENENSVYVLSNVIEYNDKIYISSYEYDKNKLDYRFIYSLSSANYNKENIDAQATNYLKDKITASLLVCNQESGLLDTFYTIPHAYGADLYINENNELVWDVYAINSVSYSPATSSFSFVVLCNLYKYVFNQNGELIKEIPTDEIVAFTTL